MARDARDAPGRKRRHDRKPRRFTATTPRNLVEDLEDLTFQVDHIISALEKGMQVPGHTVVEVLDDCRRMMYRARNFVRMEYLP